MDTPSPAGISFYITNYSLYTYKDAQKKKQDKTTSACTRKALIQSHLRYEFDEYKNGLKDSSVDHYPLNDSSAEVAIEKFVMVKI